MNVDEYNKNVPASEYRYTISVDEDTIKAVRSDEIIPIGSLSELTEFYGETYTDEMGVEIDVREMVEHITLPRLVGDELRNASTEPVGGHVLPERLQILLSTLEVSLKYGFERRENNNPL